MADQLTLAQLARLIEQYGPAQAPQADRADFLRSEKDTRPWSWTSTQGDVLPGGLNGYTGRHDVPSRLMDWLTYQDPVRAAGSNATIEDIQPGAVWAKTKNALAQGVSDIGHGAAHIAQSGVDAFTAPDRAYQGKIPQYEFDQFGNRTPSQQAISEANNLVGWSMIGGSAATKPAAMAAREADSVAFASRPKLPSAKPDDIGAFLKQTTSPNDGGSMTRTGLYENYSNWLERNGHNPLDHALPFKTFTNAIADNGLIAQRIAGRDRLIGILPKPENEWGTINPPMPEVKPIQSLPDGVSVANDSFTSPFRPGQTLYSNSSKEGGTAGVMSGALASQSSQSDRDTIARILQRMGVQ